LNTDQRILDAINLQKTGDNETAMKKLQGYVITNPDDELGWITYARITPYEGEVIRCLKRIIDINPANREVKEKLKSLGVSRQI